VGAGLTRRQTAHVTKLKCKPRTGACSLVLTSEGHSVAGPADSGAKRVNRMSEPNVDEIIEKVKQLCRLDGMLWSELDPQNRSRYPAGPRGRQALPTD
jgi:hypothetical protein